MILGITDENVKRLRAGNPIAFKARDVGLRGAHEIVICHGVDQRHIADDLRRELGIAIPDPGPLL